MKIIALVAHEVVAECRKVGQSPVNGSGASALTKRSPVGGQHDDERQIGFGLPGRSAARPARPRDVISLEDDRDHGRQRLV